MALACPTCGAPASEGARFCASCGAQLGELTDRGEQRKVVSILFADVTGAAGLEQGPARGPSLVGERPSLASRSAFTFEEPIDLDLKGKAAPVVARCLLGALAEPERGVPGLRAPMIGRDRELETLLGLFDEAVETGRPRMTVVYGPAGIGKSRSEERRVGKECRSRWSPYH